MEKSYTSWQVLDALMRQGYSAEQANAMYWAMGDERKPPDQIQAAYNAIGAEGAGLPSGKDGYQDSSLVPNLVEGTAAAAMLPVMDKYMPNKKGQSIRNIGRFVGRLAGIGIPAALIGNASIALSGNNFYDRATEPELIGDIGGSIAGGFAGEALGSRLGKKYDKTSGKDLANSKPAQDAMKKAKGVLDKVPTTKTGTTAANAIRTGVKKGATSAAGRLVGSGAGRVAGMGIGSILGPLGGLAGATLGGWLIPKFLGAGSKSVEDDNNTPKRSENVDWGILGGAAAAGAAAAHPRSREAILEQMRKRRNDAFANPLDER